MRAIVRPGVMILAMVLVVVPALRGQAQGTAKKAEAPAPAAAKAAAPKPTAAELALMKQVLATVNGEPITRRDLIEFLSQYQISLEDPQQVYTDAIETLINMKLVTQYLTRLKIPVPPERVDEAVNNLKKQLETEGTSLAQTLVDSNKGMEDVKKIYADRIRWIEFVNQRGTDAELKKYAASHKDLLNGTQVKVSHILLRIEPKATDADKAKVRQQLAGIKKDIEAKKTTFAEAANKFSQDPANSQGAGGDIGYFGLNNGIVEEFSKAAFALKPGVISDPIETPYGYHLILVTDRKEGTQLDFDQNRPHILNQYAAELQKDLLTAQRKTAQIKINDMPKDLFPAPPADAPTPAKAAEKTKAKAAK
ncbi:peptidylprolyl isomerase [Singulisphaera sp. PoT]|uniref:peptidylprolyl isomerase n=1 Tax=Singulisphaera sp. PoT TaxID=3411797 RepID=UPI003BF5C8DD